MCVFVCVCGCVGVWVCVGVCVCVCVWACVCVYESGVYQLHSPCVMPYAVSHVWHEPVHTHQFYVCFVLVNLYTSYSSPVARDWPDRV